MSGQQKGPALSRADAEQAIAILDGVLRHPWWLGVDKDGLARVVAALRTDEVRIVSGASA